MHTSIILLHLQQIKLDVSVYGHKKYDLKSLNLYSAYLKTTSGILRTLKIGHVASIPGIGNHYLHSRCIAYGQVYHIQYHIHITYTLKV